MTSPPPSPLPDPIELLPLPLDAVLLSREQGDASAREMVIAALRERLAQQGLDWSIGPTLDLSNPDRLLSINRFAVQLVCCGFTAESLPIPLAHWRQGGAAPQLLVAARVDEEAQVVQIPGVLTAPEFLAWSQAHTAASTLRSADDLDLPLVQFGGGMERLLTLAQLLLPEAISREGLAPVQAPSVSSVLDWLSGQLDETLRALGGSLVPATAGSFRSAVGSDPQALAVLAIPLGLADGALCSGREAESCVERFRLLLMPLGVNHPERLLLRLVPELEGDLLPSGLTLKAQQGDWQQQKTSGVDTSLELTFSGSGQVLQVAISFPGSPDLQLPPLALPL